MASRLREGIAPIYLLACLLLGGSGQGIWANMVLQLVGLALIGWAALLAEPGSPPRGQRHLFWLVLLALIIVLAQLIPLPADIWEQIGPRSVIAEGYRTLGIPSPSIPLSVAPYDSISSFLSLLPPIAMLAALLRLGSRPLMLVIALIAGTFASILLGALQISSPDPTASPWYLYEDTNFGVATGFFANANHMADLLVISLPFLAAVLARAGSGGRNVQRYSAAVALTAGAALVIAVGIALNGSLAGYGLAVPVLLASAMIMLPARSGALRWMAALAAVLLIASVAWLATTPISSEAAFRVSAQTSVQSREEILRTSVRAAADFMPLGSGIGTFQRVYALYEDHDRLDPTTFVNHAHNDYVELALETGVPGLTVLALFLVWWARAALRAWRPIDPDPYARAAAVASAAILIHSLVDFPLRTAAIGACFAMCLALLIRPRSEAAADNAELRPTRHVVVD
ncbi:MAG TPA: O-antigen ligase family protein [Sphingomicrobium sp.]